MLSISDVRGKGLFFGPLHKLLVLVRRSKNGNNQNGITWSVFCKPQGGKDVIIRPEFFNRELKPTVHEAS